MVHKIRQRAFIPNLSLDVPPGAVAADDTVARGQRLGVQRVDLQLSGLTINVAEADGYGSAKLCDLPDSNLLLLGCEADLVVTKAGTTDGIEAATELDLAIGTAPASASPLATNMINVVEKKDVDDVALGVDFEGHSSDNATSVMPIHVVDSASAALYLNLACTITVDDSVLCSGIVRFFYVDLGNLAS